MCGTNAFLVVPLAGPDQFECDAFFASEEGHIICYEQSSVYRFGGFLIHEVKTII